MGIIQFGLDHGYDKLPVSFVEVMAKLDQPIEVSDAACLVPNDIGQNITRMNTDSDQSTEGCPFKRSKLLSDQLDDFSQLLFVIFLAIG